MFHVIDNINVKGYRSFTVKKIGRTGILTRDISHAKRTLYHWAMPPYLHIKFS